MAAVEVDIIGVGVVMLRIMICMGGRWIVRSLLVSLIDLAFFQPAMVLFFMMEEDETSMLRASRADFFCCCSLYKSRARV